MKVPSAADHLNERFSLDEIEQIECALQCSGLQIHVRREWGARLSFDHRLKIRVDLANTISPSAAWLTDLSILPTSIDHHCSISHAQNLGGYAICARTTSISGLGFDLENLDRLSTAVIQRVASSQECSIAPDARFLWPAKEAAFKGTPLPTQPIAITEILIGNWRQLSFGLQGFEARTVAHHLGRGVIKLDLRNDEVFALFVGNS